MFKREGRYVLRTNLKESDPAKVWEFYLQLVEVEEAFKNFKGDLAIRPIFHQLEARIEAHIFVCFLAYCLQVTLRHQLRAKAPGLTVRQVLEKFGRMQMMDVHFPTTDGRELVFVRYTQPEKDQKLVAGADELGVAAAVTAENHGERRIGKWLQTFDQLTLSPRHLRPQTPSSSESRVRLKTLDFGLSISAFCFPNFCFPLGPLSAFQLFSFSAFPRP